MANKTFNTFSGAIKDMQNRVGNTVNRVNNADYSNIKDDGLNPSVQSYYEQGTASSIPEAIKADTEEYVNKGLNENAYITDNEERYKNLGDDEMAKDLRDRAIQSWYAVDNLTAYKVPVAQTISNPMYGTPMTSYVDEVKFYGEGQEIPKGATPLSQAEQIDAKNKRREEIIKTEEKFEFLSKSDRGKELLKDVYNNPNITSQGDYMKAINQAYSQYESEGLQKFVGTEIDRLDSEIAKLEEKNKKPYNFGRELSKATWGAYEGAREDKDLLRAKELLEEVKTSYQHLQEGAGFWKGLGNELFSWDTFTFGVESMLDNADIARYLNKFEEVGFDGLTETEKVVLDALIAREAMNSLPKGFLYNAGEAVGFSIPFMISYGLSKIPSQAIAKATSKATGAGIKKLGEYLSKRAAKEGVSQAIKKADDIIQKGVKKTTDFAKANPNLTKWGKEAGEVLTTGAMTSGIQTVTSPHTYGDYAERQAQVKYEVDYDDNGNVQIVGKGVEQDNNALAKAITSAFIDNMSEKVGGLLIPDGATTFMGKEIKSLVKNNLSPRQADFFKKVSAAWNNSPMREAAKAVDFGSFGQEFGEEIVAGVGNTLFVGDQTFEELFSGENMLTTALSIGAMSTAIGLVGGAINANEFRKSKRNYEESLRQLEQSIPDVATRNKIINQIATADYQGQNNLAQSIKATAREEAKKGNNREAEVLAERARNVVRFANAYNQVSVWNQALNVKLEERMQTERDHIKQNANADMDNHTIIAQYEGENYLVVGGKVAFNQDGTIDLANSSESVTIKSPDGEKQIISPEKLSLVADMSFEELDAQAQQMTWQRMEQELNTPTEETQPTQEAQPVAEQPTTEQPSSTEVETTPENTQAEQPQQPSYPTDEEGEPVFTQMPIEQTNQVINELGENADTFVSNKINEAQSRLEKAQNAKVKATKFNEMKREAEAINQEKQAAQAELDYWTQVQQARLQSGVSNEALGVNETEQTNNTNDINNTNVTASAETNQSNLPNETNEIGEETQPSGNTEQESNEANTTEETPTESLGEENTTEETRQRVTEEGQPQVAPMQLTESDRKSIQAEATRIEKGIRKMARELRQEWKGKDIYILEDMTDVFQRKFRKQIKDNGLIGAIALNAKEEETAKQTLKRMLSPKFRGIFDGMNGEEIITSFSSHGFFKDSTGKVYVNMSANLNAEDLKVTLFHEAVAHKGLRELLGKDNFNRLCQAVAEAMPTEIKERLIKAYSKSGNKITDALIADEYMASLAEQMAENNGELTIPQRIVGAMRNFFRNLFNLKLNEADIKYLLYASYKKLKGDEGIQTSINNSATLKRLQDVAVTQQAEEAVRNRLVYHGSGAEFERFDHNYMGTGEGAQAYGWGTYVTDVEGIGRTYATTMRDNLISEKHKENAIINKLANETLESNNGDKEEALNYLRSLLDEDWSDKKRVKAQIKIIETGRFLPETKVKAHLYNVDIPDDNGTNYIHWETNTQELADKLNDAYRTMLIKEKGVKEEDINPDFAPFGKGVSGGTIYKLFARELRGDKQASQFLSSLGFVGISYPAQATTGGRADGARNFVIFNEDDAQIVEHTRFRIADKDVENVIINSDGKIINKQEAINNIPKGGLIQRNKDTDKDIRISRHSLRHSALHDKSEVYQAYERIEDIIANAVKIGEEPVAKDEIGKTNSVSIFYIPINIDGNQYSARLVVKELINNDIVLDTLSLYNMSMHKEKTPSNTNVGTSNDERVYSDSVKSTYKVKDLIHDTQEKDKEILGINEKTRFRHNDIFISNAENAVLNIKQSKATPEQWIAMLKNNGGLKAGEDKWLGLEDWLKTQKGSITKDEVLKYIADNEIKVEEVEYSEDGEDIVTYEDLPVRSSSVEDWKQYGKEQGYMTTFWAADVLGGVNGKIFISRKNLKADGREVFVPAINGRYLQQIDNNFPIYYNTFEDAVNGLNDYFDKHRQKKVNRRSTEAINSTRLDYTTEGLENNREIALTVPSIESWNESDEIHFGDAGNGRAIAWIRFGETTDSEDNRVLVIDEIQSKRHQEGREKGYKSQANKTPARLEDLSFDKEGSLTTVTYKGERFYFTQNYSNEDILATINERIADGQLGASNNLIPDAPFDKNWHELAMKRMLRLAAEEGYDKIAWTTGEQQADRYDMSREIESIQSEDETITEASDGTPIAKALTIRTTSGMNIRMDVDANGMVRGGEYNGKQISDVLGKELGEKVMEKGNQTLTTPDLKIGGEGMKGFYDKILPTFMNKYGKKWGVKTESVELPSLGENGLTMHSVDVTPEMRESVMQGQVMFRFIGEQGVNFSLDDTRLRKLEEGETCKVERIFTENKSFDFTSGEKIETYEDVAFIFKQLQDESIENTFAVLVKDGKPTVIHLGMGSYTQSMINGSALNVAVERVQPDKIYFVHNHPSGQLRASQQDKNVLDNLKGIYGEDVVADGIIINLRSGKFGTFGHYDSIIYNEKDVETPVPIKVYSFNKQVFDKDYNPSELFQASDSVSVAGFISSQRLGDRPKLGLLVCNNQLQIVGNIFTKYTEISKENAKEIANDIVYYTTTMGGTRAVLFGDGFFKDITNKNISYAVEKISLGQIALNDYINVNKEGYLSAYDEGVRFRVDEALDTYAEHFSGIKETNGIVFDTPESLYEYALENGYDKEGAKEVLEQFTTNKTAAAFVPNTKDILFFAFKGGNPYAEALHEHIHYAIEQLGGIDKFLTLSNELANLDEVIVKFVSRNYKKDIEEEIITYSMQIAYTVNAIEELRNRLSKEAQTQLEEILNKTGYNKNINHGKEIERFTTESSRRVYEDHREHGRKQYRLASTHLRDNSQRGGEGATEESIRQEEKAGVNFRLSEETDNILTSIEQRNAEAYNSVMNVELPKAETPMEIARNKKVEVMFRRFTPDQDFAVNNPATMFAAANAMGFWDKQVENYWDSFITLKKYEDAIEKAYGVNLAQLGMSAYIGENTSQSRAQTRSAEFNQTYEKKLADTLKPLYKEIGEQQMKWYAIARTGLERQAIKEAEARAKAQAEGKQYHRMDYAGLTGLLIEMMVSKGLIDNKQADTLKEWSLTKVEQFAEKKGVILSDYIQEIENKMGEETTSNLWSIVREIADEKLKLQLESGLLSTRGYILLMHGVDIKPILELNQNYGYDKKLINSANLRGMTPEELLKNGIIEQHQYDIIINGTPTYQYYLPLKGNTELTAEDLVNYEQKTAKNMASIKEAKGHKNMANNPFVQLINDAYGSISAAEHNRWLRSLLRTAQQFPSADIKVSTTMVVPMTQVLPDGTQQLVYRVATQEDIERGWAETVDNKLGIDELHITKPQYQEHTVIVRDGGKIYTLEIQNHSLAEAINTLGGRMKDKNGWLAKGYDWLNRAYASLKTSLNPAFILPNMARDYGEALTNNSIIFGTKAIAPFSRAVEPASELSRGLHEYLHLRARGKMGEFKVDTPVKKLVKEFFDNGGETNYNMLSDYDTQRANLKQMMNLTQWDKTKNASSEAWKTYFGVYGNYVELMSRLATYAINRGTVDKYSMDGVQKSEQEAIFAAKEITTNFDKRGKNNKDLGRVIMFFNAGRQSNRNHWRLMKEHPLRYGLNALLMPFLAQLAMPHISAIVSMLLGDDDKDYNDYIDAYNTINKHIKSKNLVLMLGDHVLKVPVSPSFAPMLALGNAVNSVIFPHRNGADFGDFAVSLLDCWTSVASIGGVFSPVGEAIINRDYADAPIYREGERFKTLPSWHRAYDDTPELLINLNKFLNRISGGNSYTIGSETLDRLSNPGAIYHILTSWGGGYAEMANSLIRLCDFVSLPNEADALKRGGDVLKRTLIVNRFYAGNINDYIARDVEDAYWEIRELQATVRNGAKQSEIPVAYKKLNDAINSSPALDAYEAILKQSKRVDPSARAILKREIVERNPQLAKQILLEREQIENAIDQLEEKNLNYGN